MKNRIFLISFVVLICLPFAFSLNEKCKYADIESNMESEMVLCYSDSTIIGGKALVFTDFIKGNGSSFMVYNPNRFIVEAFFNYTLQGYTGGIKKYGLKIEPFEYKQVKEHCYDGETFGECYIIPESVSYYVTKPRLMYPKIQNVTKNVTVCDKQCIKDTDCNSAICNIAGYCGKERIVLCLDGTQNCQNVSCLKPNSKEFGESYSCIWECKTGIGKEGICKMDDGATCETDYQCVSETCNIAGVCGPFVACLGNTKNCNNISCLKPTVKKIGEPYFCVWECESGEGRKGICSDTIINIIKKIVYSIFLMLIVLFLIIFVLKKRILDAHLNSIKEGIRKLVGEVDVKLSLIKDLEKRGTELERIIKTYREVIILKEDEINKRKQQLNIIRDKIKESKGKARKKYHDEYTRLVAQRKDLIDETEKIKKINQERERELERSKRIEKEKENHILETYKKKYGHEFIIENGYIRFAHRKDDPNNVGEYFHRWIAKKQIYLPHINFYNKRYGISYEYLEVHHINDDKLDNNEQNLIILSKEEHSKIINIEIPKGNYEAGIRLLKNKGFKAPHIKELNSDI